MPADLFDERDRETFQKAVETWGIDAQVDMAVEECGELIVALQQYQRGRATVYDVIDELADIGIMREQLRLFFDPDDVDIKTQSKMDRLRERLDEDEPAMYTSQNGGRSSGTLHTRRDCRHLVNVPDEYIVEGTVGEEFVEDQDVCGTCEGGRA